jgi:hypothetical protein
VVESKRNGLPEQQFRQPLHGKQSTYCFATFTT